MSGNIYWRGRQKALQQKKATRSPSPPPSAKKGRSLAQKIRDAKRLLAKEGLPAEVKKEKQILLQSLEKMRDQQLLTEKERKFAKKYHKVKFFERQKLTRRIKQLQKELEKSEPGGKDGEVKKEGEDAASATRAKLERLEGDLLYVLNFPNSERYISIIKDIADREVLEKRNVMRQRILSQPDLRTLEQADKEDAEGEEDSMEESKKENREARRKPDAKQQQNSHKEKSASQEGEDDSDDDGDEADDEDDKEEKIEKEAKKPPKKKAKVSESTETDPQEYGEALAPARDSFFLAEDGTAISDSDGPEADDNDDDAKQLWRGGNKRGRGRGRGLNGKSTSKQRGRNKFKKPNSDNNKKNAAGNKRNMKQDGEATQESPVSTRVQKHSRAPFQDRRTKQQGRRGSTPELPAGSNKQRDSPIGQKTGQRNKGAGKKRKLETNTKRPSEADKVEEVPSRKKRRSGQSFEVPVGGRKAEKPTPAQKKKKHVFFG